MIGKTAAMAALSLGLLAGAPASAGTPEQEAACRHDVRRFCHHVQGGGDDAYLSCLQAHRPKLSAACRKVLEAGGV